MTSCPSGAQPYRVHTSGKAPIPPMRSRGGWPVGEAKRTGGVRCLKRPYPRRRKRANTVACKGADIGKGARPTFSTSGPEEADRKFHAKGELTAGLRL